MPEFRMRIYAILFLIGVSIFYASGIVFALTSQLGERGWTCSSLPCWISALTDLIGIVLMILSGLRILPQILTSAVKVPGNIFDSPEVGSSPDEKEILWRTNELLPNLRLRGWRSVQSIEWADNQRWYLPHFSKKGLTGPAALVLPSSLLGRLAADDWTTLLMYYFLQYRLGVRRILEILLRLVWPFLPLILVSFLVSFVYGPSGGLLYSAIVGPPFAFLLLLHTTSAIRKIFLKEDSRITQTVSVQKLVRCFRAIDHLRLPDVENGKNRTGWTARLWPVPNITKRISNLEQRKANND